MDVSRWNRQQACNCSLGGNEGKRKISTAKIHNLIRAAVGPDREENAAGSFRRRRAGSADTTTLIEKLDCGDPLSRSATILIRKFRLCCGPASIHVKVHASLFAATNLVFPEIRLVVPHLPGPNILSTGLVLQADSSDPALVISDPGKPNRHRCCRADDLRRRTNLAESDKRRRGHGSRPAPRGHKRVQFLLTHPAGDPGSHTGLRSLAFLTHFVCRTVGNFFPRPPAG